MKITISKEELAQGVQTIQSALSSRTTLPILLNFLLETEDKKVKVVSTDLEMGVKHYIKADIENDGSITIPAGWRTRCRSGRPSALPFCASTPTGTNPRGTSSSSCIRC
jgi:hypothetical protein